MSTQPSQGVCLLRLCSWQGCSCRPHKEIHSKKRLSVSLPHIIYASSVAQNRQSAEDQLEIYTPAACLAQVDCILHVATSSHVCNRLGVFRCYCLGMIMLRYARVGSHQSPDFLP